MRQVVFSDQLLSFLCACDGTHDAAKQDYQRDKNQHDCEQVRQVLPNAAAVDVARDRQASDDSGAAAIDPKSGNYNWEKFHKTNVVKYSELNSNYSFAQSSRCLCRRGKFLRVASQHAAGDEQQREPNN
jgi:hypothetical protein